MTEGKQLADRFGCAFIETSAKSRLKVEDAFYDLVREIRKYNQSLGLPPGASKEANGRKLDNMNLDDGERSAGCCGGKCIVM